jgi:hypothetical protein
MFSLRIIRRRLERAAAPTDRATIAATWLDYFNR